MKKESFVRMPIWLLKSDAHRALSPHAKIVHLYVLAGHNGRNNGQIRWTERQLADESGLHRHTVRKALRELQAAGFITCTFRAGFNNKREASRYQINWLDGATPTGEGAP